MKYCEDCTSATWCYDQGKCDRAKVEVSEAALESLKAMAQRLQNQRDELLHAVIQIENALEDGHWQETKSWLRNLIAKCTAKPKVFE